MRAAAMVAALMLAGAPVAAQEAARIAEFLAVVEAAGCVIHERNDQDILRELAMTEEEGGAIVQVLMLDGRAVPQGNDLRITTGSCG